MLLNPLIAEYMDENNRSCMGTLIHHEDFYMECGREQTMYFKQTSPPDFSIMTRDEIAKYWESNKALPYPQVTIRDIRIHGENKKNGWLTQFIAFLFTRDNIEAVQLEAIQPEWLKERLEESDVWVRQSEYQYKDFSPCYVRFKSSINKNEKFKLFQ